MNPLPRISHIRQNLLIYIVLAVGLLVRLALMHLRWINPDEGAHLMDAKLLLQGSMPVADFGSRQPFYVLLLAVLLKCFGSSLLVGRMLPLISSLAAGWMIFLIGKKLFDYQTGLIAMSIYLFLPLTLIWSVIVKTEQPTIFLACASVYFLLLSRSGHIRKSGWIILSGIFSALAFYVRQPALYMPLAIVLFLSFKKQESVLERVRLIGLFVLGYFSIVLLCFALLSVRMSWQEIFFSQLNPLHLVWNRLASVFGMLPPSQAVVDTPGFRLLDQPMEYTLTAWQQSFLFCLFIIAAAVFRIALRKEGDDKRATGSENFVLLFIFWACSVLALYLFQTANRGFYTQYFTEALPPLVLLASAFFNKIYGRHVSLTKMVFPLVLFFFIFVTQRLFWHIFPGMVFYLAFALVGAGTLTSVRFKLSLREKIFGAAILPLALTVVFYPLELLTRSTAWPLVAAFITGYYFMVRFFKNKSSIAPAGEKTFAASYIMIAAFLISAAFSGHVIGPRYEAIWSQKTLKQVAGTLARLSDNNSEVLSGGTIWAFQAGLDPFLKVPHPTEFFKKLDSNFQMQFRNNRPDFIILDGYTER